MFPHANYFVKKFPLILSEGVLVFSGGDNFGEWWWFGGAKVSPRGEVASASFSAVGIARPQVAISCCASTSTYEIASGVFDMGEGGADVVGRVDVFKGVRVDLDISDDVFDVK